MMERSSDMIAVILGILKAGGAYLPIEPDLPEERKNYMLADSSAKILLTNLPGAPLHHSSFIETPNHPGNLAYLIYTSGSTGRPKGVMMEHRSVVNYITWAANMYVKGESVDFPLYTSISFDLTVTSLFTPLITGNAVVIYNEDDIGELIERIVRENRVGVVKLTPSHLKVLAQEENIAGSTIKRLIVGGEALETQLALDIHETFNGHIQIYNEYGPTEAAVGCMVYPFDPTKDKRKSVPIGLPVANTRIYILDNWQKPVPVGVVGEMYIAGIGLARGYLNNPELTAEKFIENPYKAGERLYKSGDLARLSADGEMEYLGRIDHQVKIRGFRVEVGEIESRLMCHDSVKEAVVVAASDRSGDKYLCAYFVPHSPHSPHSTILREYLAKTLPQYMIPSYFVPLEKIPLTSNGKINRKALPGPEVKAGEPGTYTAPGNRVEATLVKVWADVLGTDSRHIGINDNFFDLGGHSLKATVLAAKIHKALNIKVPLVEIFKSPTVRGLSSFIKGAGENQFIPIEPTEDKEYYPLTSAQKRLYILQQMDKGSIAYNVPHVLELDEKTDVLRLETVFKQLIKRHESLRTSFLTINDEPVQRIHDDVEFTIETNDSIPHFVRPFDLSRPPLMRLGLLSTGEGRYVMMVDMHHIISDAISEDVLVQDFGKFYKGETLPPLRLQYKDFSQWENQWRASPEGNEAVKKQETYWLNEFKGRLPILNLPTDYVRPAVKSLEGKTVFFDINPENTAALKAIALEQGATLYMTVLAVYNLFLFKLSGQEDIIIGSPIAGRKHIDLYRIIGMFVGTMALRNYPAPAKTFKEFLEEVKHRTLDAFENQDYPFEELQEKISANFNKDAGRNPVFDVFFQFGTFDSNGRPDQVPGNNHRYENRTSKFDMYLYGEERGNQLVFSLEYCTRLFKEETIGMFIENFKKIVSQVVENKDIKLEAVTVSHGIYNREMEIPDTGFAF
jgi:tyrocidine synthetase-3